MKNNFYNIPESWYQEINNNFDVYEKNNNTNLANPKEAFLKGNLFNNLYNPYKNYQYGKLIPTNAKEELLYNILMNKFVLNELNLYLDVFPNNMEMINLYKKYLTEEKRLCLEFERNYGPLSVDSDNLGTNSWNWIKSPWPWEGTR
jgi:spore coat protein JB